MRAMGWNNRLKPKMVAPVRHLQTLGWFADEWTDTTRAIAKIVVGIHASGNVQTSSLPY